MKKHWLNALPIVNESMDGCCFDVFELLTSRKEE